jgi:hypothetical protein
MIVEHSATVLPFTDALLRRPRSMTPALAPDQRTAPEGELPDNVIVLARFTSRARHGRGRFLPGTPPDGEAA